MIILGLDPGTAITGYGIISKNSSKVSGICYGVIRTLATDSMSRRLKIIFDEIEDILNKYNPTEVAIEKLFFGSNKTTAITVGQARGILLLQAERFQLPIYEYTPMQIKQAMVGYGLADKKQIQKMVMKYLSLGQIPKPDDAADALAIAICHAHRRNGKI